MFVGHMDVFIQLYPPFLPFLAVIRDPCAGPAWASLLDHREENV